MINNDIFQMLFYYIPNTAFIEFSRSTSANHCHVAFVMWNLQQQKKKRRRLSLIPRWGNLNNYSSICFHKYYFYLNVASAYC